MKKSSPFNSVEKVVPIQLIWKSRSHSTHLKKPSSFNSYEKVVFIQLIWELLREYPQRWEGWEGAVLGPSCGPRALMKRFLVSSSRDIDTSLHHDIVLFHVHCLIP
jgi:hypothetical protein